MGNYFQEQREKDLIKVLEYKNWKKVTDENRAFVDYAEKEGWLNTTFHERGPMQFDIYARAFPSWYDIVFRENFRKTGRIKFKVYQVLVSIGLDNLAENMFIGRIEGR